MRVRELHPRIRRIDVMLTNQELLTGTYRAFNARDIDTVLDVMHPEVSWPNGWEGGRLHGHQALRDYWMRQWSAIDPTVKPISFSINAAERIVVRVNQVVHDLQAIVISDEIV